MNNIYQAIVTKYLGPTNSRGSRIKATASAGSITIGWDHAGNSEFNHERAAVALANKYNWLTPKTRIHAGALPKNDKNDYVFVLVQKDGK